MKKSIILIPLLISASVFAQIVNKFPIAYTQLLLAVNDKSKSAGIVKDDNNLLFFAFQNKKAGLPPGIQLSKTNSTKPEAEIEKILRERLDAALRGDTATWRKHISNDCIWSGPGQGISSTAHTAWENPPNASLPAKISEKQIRQIDSLFAPWNKTNSPGCAIGVIKDGKLTYERGYGMASLEHGSVISPNTVFDVGSVSKQFTATAIILLQQQGKLLIDDNVRKYIPELPDYGKPITIRQLLSHTSGLRDYCELLLLAGAQEANVSTKQDALDIITRQKALNFMPGEKFEYCNTGFFLASVIVERVSGESMKVFAQQNIFSQLEMNNTFYLDNHTTIVPNRATGYAPGEADGFRTSMSDWEQTGDGNVQTNIKDLLLWDRNFYDPKVGGKDLIKALTTVGTLNNGDKTSYGFGLFKEVYQGLEIIQHGGTWVGYRADLIRFPTEKFSVICLSNLSAFKPDQFTRAIAKIVLADKLQPDTLFVGSKTGSKPISTENLMTLTGFYRSESNDLTRQIQVENGKLFYVRSAINKVELLYQGNEKFLMSDANITVKFNRDKDNKAESVELYNPVIKSQILLVRFLQVKFDKAELSKYAGDYYSEELNATYKLEAGDSALLIRQPQNPEPLVEVPETSTTFIDSDGESVELFTGKKNLVGFYFSVPRANKILFLRK